MLRHVVAIAIGEAVAAGLAVQMVVDHDVEVVDLRVDDHPTDSGIVRPAEEAAVDRRLAHKVEIGIEDADGACLAESPGSPAGPGPSR